MSLFFVHLSISSLKLSFDLFPYSVLQYISNTDKKQIHLLWENMRGQDFFSPSLFLVTTTHAVGRQWAAEGCVWRGYKDPRGDGDKACGLALALQHHIQRVTALKWNPNRVSTGTWLPFTAAYMFVRERNWEIRMKCCKYFFSILPLISIIQCIVPVQEEKQACLDLCRSLWSVHIVLCMLLLYYMKQLHLHALQFRSLR